MKKRVVFTIVVVGLLVLSHVYQITKSPSVIIEPKPCSVGLHNSTFLRALVQHASPDRYIILALVDAAFVDMAINLYHTSFLPYGINNFLFVGVGRRVCDLLVNSSSLHCYHYANDTNSDQASVYLSTDFIRKMNIRTDMILEALNAGFTVVHTDLDVFFFRNPLPHLKVRYFALLLLGYSTLYITVAFICCIGLQIFRDELRRFNSRFFAFLRSCIHTKQ